jgi:hypothetical protein
MFEVNFLYKINDYRILSFFKDKTFSGYMKAAVIQKFNKCLLEDSIEESCFWAVELIISGQIDKVLDKILNVYNKYVHINNPNLSEYLFTKYEILVKIIKNDYYKLNSLNIRNNQIVRNYIAELITLVCLSKKDKPLKLCSIKAEEFNINKIKDRLKANNDLLGDILREGDPGEVKIILNEFYFSLTNKNYKDSIYWLSWMLEWSKINIKKNKRYKIGFRHIKGIDKLQCYDMIWIFWEVILKFTYKLDNDKITSQIMSMYKFFKINFKSGILNKKMVFVIHAIKFLTSSIFLDQKIVNNYGIYIQACGNINYIYKDLKKNEQANDPNYDKKINLLSSSVESVPRKKSNDNNPKNLKKNENENKNNNKNKNTKPKELSESSKKFDLLSQIDSKRLSDNSIKNKIVKKKKEEINQKVILDFSEKKSTKNVISEIDNIIKTFRI